MAIIIQLCPIYFSESINTVFSDFYFPNNLGIFSKKNLCYLGGEESIEVRVTYKKIPNLLEWPFVYTKNSSRHYFGHVIRIVYFHERENSLIKAKQKTH